MGLQSSLSGVKGLVHWRSTHGAWHIPLWVFFDPPSPQKIPPTKNYLTPPPNKNVGHRPIYTQQKKQHAHDGVAYVAWIVGNILSIIMYADSLSDCFKRILKEGKFWHLNFQKYFGIFFYSLEKKVSKLGAYSQAGTVKKNLRHSWESTWRQPALKKYTLEKDSSATSIASDDNLWTKTFSV